MPSADLPSYAQEQLLIAIRRLGERGIDVGANVVPMVCRVAGPVDVAALDRALAALVERHDALRVRFEVSGDGRARRVVVADPVSWTVVDAEPDAPPDRVEQQAWKLVEQPIDPFGWPLVRATIVQGDPAYLVVSLHHLIADDYSLHLVEQDLRDLYRAELAGSPARLEPAGSFLAHTDEERERCADDDFRKRVLADIGAMLAGRPLMTLLAPEIENTAEPGSWHWATAGLLGPGELAAFERRCFANGGTLFAGLLAAFGRALRQAAGVTEFGTMVVFGGRDDQRWDNTVGWFATSAPCYLAPPDAAGFVDHLRPATEALLRTYDSTRVPLALAMREFDPQTYRGDGEHRPNCLLSFIPDPDGAGDPADDAWTRLEPPRVGIGSASYVFWLRRGPDGLTGMSAGPGSPLLPEVEREFVTTLRAWCTDAGVSREDATGTVPATR